MRPPLGMACVTASATVSHLPPDGVPPPAQNLCRPVLAPVALALGWHTAPGMGAS